MNRSVLLITGFVSGLLITVLLLTLGFFYLSTFLVVESVSQKVDAIVVLGGGDGSRFHKAMQLSADGLTRTLVLVDGKKSYWNHIAPDICDNNEYQGSLVVCLDGSTSTKTDAELTHAFGLKQEWQKVIVVTDPYHSRRAQMNFEFVYAGSAIAVDVISSDNFGRFQPPSIRWWQDVQTRQAVWLEFGKILYFKVGAWFPWLIKE